MTYFSLINSNHIYAKYKDWKHLFKAIKENISLKQKKIYISFGKERGKGESVDRHESWVLLLASNTIILCISNT